MTMTPAQRIAALEVEADRLKDRLDNLDRILRGDSDAWLGIIERLPPTVAEVVITAPLAEARQNALALATVTKTLAGLSADAPAASVADPADEIAKKRQANLDAAREKTAQ